MLQLIPELEMQHLEKQVSRDNGPAVWEDYLDRYLGPINFLHPTHWLALQVITQSRVLSLQPLIIPSDGTPLFKAISSDIKHEIGDQNLLSKEI